MCEEINININETNEIINIVSTEIVEVIDVNVGETVEEVTFNITEEIIQVNINKVTGGGGEQTLAETLVLGNNTGGTDILLNNDDAIQLENNSSIKKGTYDYGQGGGVSRICGVDYEDMWQGGIRHVFDSNGYIRNSTNGFNSVPNFSFDASLRFKVGSFWTLDDGTTYICTDATIGAAVWELYNVIPTNTSDLTNDGEDGVNPFITADDVPSQVNSDWNATSGVEEILNKPTIPTQTSDLTNNGADGTNPFITALDIPTTGQASTLVREVKNMTGATLTKGTVVYISGANGNKALVSKALATTDELSSRTFGLLQSNILNNGLGYCVIIGDLSGLNTSSFAEGAQLYLSGTVAGTYTDTKVLAPTHLVYVGKVTRSHPTQGQIEVGIQNGYELAEIHDVALSSEANNQALVYESSSDLWKNKTIDKTFVGLGNVDNTSDANKPVSSAQTTAINAKVSDAIVNGVTTIAPSQNAVFDALALKQNTLSYTPYKFIETRITAHTGTVAETIVATATIAGGTFNSTDVMKVMFGANKAATAVGSTMRLRINTSNTLTGSVIVGVVFSTVASVTILKRNFMLNNGTLNGLNFTLNNTPNDEANVLNTYSSTSFNTANTLYLFFTLQLGNVVDSVTPNLFNITN